MRKTEMSEHTQLLSQIMNLKVEKRRIEEEVKYKFKEYLDTMKPASLMKESLRELLSDKEAKLNLAKMGLTIGSKFLIDRLLNKQGSIKGFLSSLLVEGISTSFIKTNSSEIISGISKLISPDSK